MAKKRNGPYPTHPSERFWDKVSVGLKDECWEWNGARHPEGYGFMFAGKAYGSGMARWIKVHRLSWEIHNGPIHDGLQVLHHCDNPPCVNPAHLYVGTQLQNIRDRAQRRRGKEHHQNGIANDNAKLTEADVRAIIALLKTGRSQTEIAKIFGVVQPHISRIAHKTSWQHIWDE